MLILLRSKTASASFYQETTSSVVVVGGKCLHLWLLYALKFYMIEAYPSGFSGYFDRMTMIRKGRFIVIKLFITSIPFIKINNVADFFTLLCPYSQAQSGFEALISKE